MKNLYPNEEKINESLANLVNSNQTVQSSYVSVKVDETMITNKPISISWTNLNVSYPEKNKLFSKCRKNTYDVESQNKAKVIINKGKLSGMILFKNYFNLLYLFYINFKLMV